MKKFIFLAFLGIIFAPSFAKANLMGFGDGSIFDPSISITEPQFICFLNNECLKKDGTITSRSVLGLAALPETQTTIISTPLVQQVIYLPLPTSALGNVQPTPTPVVSSTPKPVIDTTKPKITLFRYNDSYPNPIPVTTNEPTTAKLYYLDFSSNEAVRNSYAQSKDTSVLNPVLQSEGEKVTSFLSSNTLSTKHYFDVSSFLDKHKYFLKLIVTDKAGNESSVDWSWGVDLSLCSLADKTCE